METDYIVVFNDRKKGEASAALLCQKMNAGALIISAVPTHDSVHYILGYVEPAGQPPMTKDDRDIIRDNLDAEDRAEERDHREDEPSLPDRKAYGSG